MSDQQENQPTTKPVYAFCEICRAPYPGHVPWCCFSDEAQKRRKSWKSKIVWIVLACSIPFDVFIISESQRRDAQEQEQQQQWDQISQHADMINPKACPLGHIELPVDGPSAESSQ
jgi:hypothetical protein